MRRSFLMLFLLAVSLGVLSATDAIGQFRPASRGDGLRPYMPRQGDTKLDTEFQRKSGPILDDLSDRGEQPRVAARESRNGAALVSPFLPTERRLPLPTTGHRSGFGPVVGLAELPPRRAINVLRGSGVFNYEYGFINPYYPFAWDAPVIRPGANDSHGGWVSKYLYTRPTVSPYMGIVRHDIVPNGATKYATFARPRIDQFYGLRPRPTLPNRPTANFNVGVEPTRFDFEQTRYPAVLRPSTALVSFTAGPSK